MTVSETTRIKVNVSTSFYAYSAPDIVIVVFSSAYCVVLLTAATDWLGANLFAMLVVKTVRAC